MYSPCFAFFFIFSCLHIEPTAALAEFGADKRCRCICPDLDVMDKKPDNDTIKEGGEAKRRIYTNVTAPLDCNPDKVVGSYTTLIPLKKEPERFKTFLAKCQCKFESRNPTMLKVVVIFVVAVLGSLVCYMLFLLCLDPMLRKQRGGVRYQQQTDEDENIFAPPSSVASVLEEETTVRSRGERGILTRVEQEQHKWMSKVEEQRKNIFTDHTMLN